MEHGNKARGGGQCWEWKMGMRPGEESNELGNEHRENGQHWEWSLGMRLGETDSIRSEAWE